MTDREQELRDQLVDATHQIGVMADLLRECHTHIGAVIHHSTAAYKMACDLRGQIDDLMAGKLPGPPVPYGWRVELMETRDRQGVVSIAGPGVYGMMMPVSYSMLDFFKALVEGNKSEQQEA